MMKKIPAKVLKYFRGFLYFLLIFVVGVLVFSQTSLFRSILKDQLTSILNESLQGRVEIGGIEGTLVTSLMVNDIRVSDTLHNEIAFIKRLEVYPRLLEILSGRIHVHKIRVEGLWADLVVDSAGVLNVMKILPKSKEEVKDTVSKPFPYVLMAETIEIVNSSVYYRKWDKIYSKEAFVSMNMDDLRIPKLDIKLNDIKVDLAKGYYAVDIEQFMIEPNFKNTPKLSITGELKLDGRIIDVNDLSIVTNKSDISFDYFTDELNPFNNFTTDSLKAAKFALTIECKPFHFDDLTTVLNGFDLIKGPMQLGLQASGDMKNTKITSLSLEALTTKLYLTGSILNLLEFDKMKILADIKKSVLNPQDIHTIMPGLNLSKFLDFPTVTIDSLGFYGAPLTFKGGVGLRSDNGNISGNYSFDFSKPQSLYEIDLNTENLNISKYINFPVKLTSKIRAKGSGFNPENAVFELDFDGTKSLAGKYLFDKLSLKTKGSSGKIGLELKTVLGVQNGELSGEIDFSNMKRPLYSITSAFNNVDLEYFIGDSSLSSALNFTFDAEGEGFEPNDMILSANLNLLDTRIKGDSLGEIDASIKLFATPDMQKDIFITSNLFTISAAGTFDYGTLGNSLSRESNKLVADVTQILLNYYPDFFEDSNATVAAKSVVDSLSSFSITTNDSLAYSFQVKDLGPLRNFLKLKTFDIEGSVSGHIVLDTQRVSYYLKNDLDRFRFRASDTSSIFILWGSQSEIKLEHPSDNISIGSLKGSVKSLTKKIFLLNNGKTDTLTNTELVMSLEKAMLDLERVDINYNDMLKARVALVVDFMRDSLELDMYETRINYKGYEVENIENTVLAFSNDAFFVKNFSLGQGDEKMFTLDARITGTTLDTKMRLENLTLQELMRDVLQQQFNQPVDANLNFEVVASGTYNDPYITTNFTVNDFKYKNEQLGKLILTAVYEDEVITPVGKFYSGATTGNDSLLSLTGVIPYKISFSEGVFDFIKDKETDIKLSSDNFSLSALNGFVPNVEGLQGILQAQIEMKGFYPNLVRNGSAEVKNGLFKVSMTKLYYGLQMGVTLSDSTVSLTRFLLTNEGEVGIYGKLTGSGDLRLRGYEVVSGDLKFGGQLTVLESLQRSKEMPVFGKVVISTNQDILVKLSPNNLYVNASINIDKMDVTMPPTQSGVANAGDNYIYRYKRYDLPGLQGDSAIIALFDDVEVVNDTVVVAKKGLPFNLDYQLKITMSKDSKMTMILSQEANQKLTTLLEGELVYEKMRGFENVQGELTVSDESRLEFLNLKTFVASGKLRFEKEIFNPYLDIVANYNSYYVFSSKGASNEQPVQVKLKLKGSMDELSTTFAKESDNIAVYVGEDNIRNEVPSPQYDKADAVWFILTGKFKSDLTEADKNSAEGQISSIQGTATSLAGSLLGGLLSSYLGDYVKSLDVRAAGGETKFNLSGQISNIKYSFGGTTNVFQDLSSATFKFEIPVIKNFLLRIERRESINEGSSSSTMINEMGLKYKIEF